MLLENIPTETIGQKRRIQRTLSLLKRRGINGITPYHPLPQGGGILTHRGSFWQLSDFISSVTLKRPDYAYEGWRGRAMAEFLIELRTEGGEIPVFDRCQPFQLQRFLIDLFRRLERFEADLYLRLKPERVFLERHFFATAESMPIGFCHGDFHPMNILWGEHRINAVIDWEFCGYKSEIYDMALMIGCAGMEEPSSLTQDMVCEFLRCLRSSSRFSSYNWEILFPFVLAVRWAWLSEWLRGGDREMIELEAVYMRMLFENRSRLTEAWKNA